MKRLVPFLMLLLILAVALPAAAEPVNPNHVYPKSLKMSKAAATIVNAAGKANTLQLKATTVPALNLLTAPVITWSSDDEAVARVDENGLVTAAGEGVTRIRASIQGKTKVLSVACRVTVKAVRVSSISLDCQDLLLLDHTKQSERSQPIRATILPATATYQGVTWTSSDASVASVDEGGTVTAHRAGEALITATTDNGRKKVSCTVRARDTSGMTAITLSAGGDIVLGGDPLKKTDKRFADMISQSGAPDYGYVLKNLKSVFVRDDLTILNLEGPLKGGGRPKKPERQYNFYGKPEYARILVEGSVEVANITNNHINDYGTKGATKQILRENGIVVSDMTYSAASSSAVVKGVRVGFLGFQTPYSSATVRSRIRDAKKTCDVVVVSFHFGEVPEHTHPVRSSQIKQARGAIDAGADLVLGHHPHVISGIERYNGKYIFYGLGAVESSGPRFKYPNFIMQQVILVDPGTGYTEPLVPTIYPIFTSGAPMSEQNNCQPILLSPSDDRYYTVKDLIDRYSQGKGLKPAPYTLAAP